MTHLCDSQSAPTAYADLRGVYSVKFLLAFGCSSHLSGPIKKLIENENRKVDCVTVLTKVVQTCCFLCCSRYFIAEWISSTCSDQWELLRKYFIDQN